MDLCNSFRISGTRVYSLSFMSLSSNLGRINRVPPYFPVRFHPSDVIEFGSDKKVPQLHYSDHLLFFFPPYVANYSDQDYVISRWAMNCFVTISSVSWSTSQTYRPCSGWRFWTHSHMNPREDGAAAWMAITPIISHTVLSSIQTSGVLHPGKLIENTSNHKSDFLHPSRSQTWFKI